MNALEKYHAARAAALDGRHAEALQGYMWFHQHALAEEPSLSGVRLSFALAAWMDLGAAYPEALLALAEIRDHKVEALLHGEADRNMFFDVVAINEYVGASLQNYQLFLRLLAARPEFATKIARSAMPAIVAARDFRLAEQLMPDPATTLHRLAREFNDDVRMIKHRRFTRAPARWAFIRIYVDEVQLFLKVAIGNGDQIGAARIKALAVALVQSPSVRDAVAAEFVRPAKPPTPKMRSKRGRARALIGMARDSTRRRREQQP